MTLIFPTLASQISTGVNSSLDGIRTNIQNDVSSANNAIQSAVSAINVNIDLYPQKYCTDLCQDVTKLVDVTLTVPQFTIPSLTALQNVTIVTAFESTLISLNNSLPSLSDLKAKMDSIVDMPFELLKAEINQTRLEISASFKSSILPVPSIKALSANDANGLNNDLCTGLDTSLIDDTAKALHELSNVVIGLMFLLLVLVWLALCVWEWKRWTALKTTVDEVEAEYLRAGTTDPWRVVTIVEHPVLERYGSAILSRIAPARTTMNIRWFRKFDLYGIATI